MMKKKNCKVAEPSYEQMGIALSIHFSEEIIMEILSRLPVRSLLRFKCVSKFWKALISDPYFKKKHLNCAKNDKKILVARERLMIDEVFSFYFSSLSPLQLFDDEQKLDCPSSCKPESSKIYCCCDGLVLLWVSDRPDEQLLLWNPSTRESIVLPLPESRMFGCICGFGYDATSDDYKILMIDMNGSGLNEVSGEIISLKSNAWRKIGKYPTGIRRMTGFRDCGMDSLALVHGAFHWLGWRQYNTMHTIVSFDISNEAYGELSTLEQQMYPKLKRIYVEHGLSVLEGMLCFYCTYHNEREGIFKLWLMKEYGVKESWIEVLTMQDTNLFYSARPKYRFADGEVLLRCGHALRGGRVFMISGGPFRLWPEIMTVMQGMICTESLISPKLLA